MSVARIYTVNKSKRDYTCGATGHTIPAGSPYRWFKVGFRSRTKQIRCMDHDPKMSERESSKMAGVWAALEDAESQISALAGDVEYRAYIVLDNITLIMGDAADAIREVADEYREAAEAMGGAGEEMEEKADLIEDGASEIEGWSGDLEDPDDDEEIDPDEAISDYEGRFAEVRDEAISLLWDTTFD